jgi:hypothetical protein
MGVFPKLAASFWCDHRLLANVAIATAARRLSPSAFGLAVAFSSRAMTPLRAHRLPPATSGTYAHDMTPSGSGVCPGLGETASTLTFPGGGGRACVRCRSSNGESRWKRGSTRIPNPRARRCCCASRLPGVWHSDVHIWDGHFDLGGGHQISLESRGVRLPFTMGHEIAGEVPALGPGASGVKVGGLGEPRRPNGHRPNTWARCGRQEHLVATRQARKGNTITRPYQNSTQAKSEW